ELECLRLRAQIQRLKESVLASAATSPPVVASQPNQASPIAPQVAQPSSPVYDDAACKREQATLKRLRASRNRDEVVRFERDLTCARRRSQVVRLRESVVTD